MSIIDYAKEQYSKTGVDTDKALAVPEKISISLNCWKGGGFHGDDRFPVPSARADGYSFISVSL